MKFKEDGGTDKLGSSTDGATTTVERGELGAGKGGGGDHVGTWGSWGNGPSTLMRPDVKASSFGGNSGGGGGRGAGGSDSNDGSGSGSGFSAFDKTPTTTIIKDDNNADNTSGNSDENCRRGGAGFGRRGRGVAEAAAGDCGRGGEGGEGVGGGWEQDGSGGGGGGGG